MIQNKDKNKFLEKIGGRCVEDSNPSGLNPVAQMVEHTSTKIYSN
jgi:hypothetical protein